MIEQWKPVPDYPYEVSDLGRVRRTTSGPNTYIGRIIKPILQKRHGYHHVILYRNNVQKQWRLPVLIALVFLGPANGREVNHKDTIKTNDWLSNLEYLTKTEHEKHTQANDLRPKGDMHPAHLRPEKMSRGMHRYNHKLTDDLVRLIRARTTGSTTLARELGVSKSLIHYVRQRKGWNHVQ